MKTKSNTAYTNAVSNINENESETMISRINSVKFAKINDRTVDGNEENSRDKINPSMLEETIKKESNHASAVSKYSTQVKNNILKY